MVNTVVADMNVELTPALPPKRLQSRNNNTPRPIAIPPPPYVSEDEMSPPTYDAPPIPSSHMDTLCLPSRKDDLARLSDGEDYLPLEDVKQAEKDTPQEAIYTSLAGNPNLVDYHSDLDDYDDVEYINIKYMRPPPSRLAVNNALSGRAEEGQHSIQAGQKQPTLGKQINNIDKKENQASQNKMNPGQASQNKMNPGQASQNKMNPGQAGLAERIQQFENY